MKVQLARRAMTRRQALKLGLVAGGKVLKGAAIGEQ